MRVLLTARFGRPNPRLAATPGNAPRGDGGWVGPIDQAFKLRMDELGYAEGQQVSYAYRGVLDADSDAIEREVRAFRDRKVDLLLALGRPPAVAAKKFLAGTGIPVVFAPVSSPLPVARGPSSPVASTGVPCRRSGAASSDASSSSMSRSTDRSR
jgi:hypothetical protein